MTPSDFTIDLRHLGRVSAVACRVLITNEGPVLVDPGPGSTLETLTAELASAGIGVTDLRALLLTHIHFDHAGATGLLTEANPALAVYVHARGAPHLADPSRLIASATRIYGDAMDRLWGRLLPVPAERLVVLHGEETVRVGDRQWRVLATPGHAVHHVCYVDALDGTAYVGDTAGIRWPGLPCPLPVTPPPDVSLEAWFESLTRIAAAAPTRLFVTHFGLHDDPAAHLEALREGLHRWAQWAQALLQDDTLSDGARADRFQAQVLEWLAPLLPAHARDDVASFADFRASYAGLARYWRSGAAPG